MTLAEYVKTEQYDDSYAHYFKYNELSRYRILTEEDWKDLPEDKKLFYTVAATESAVLLRTDISAIERNQIVAEAKGLLAKDKEE